MPYTKNTRISPRKQPEIGASAGTPMGHIIHSFEVLIHRHLAQPGDRSIFQSTEISDQSSDVGLVKFCAEPGHFTFDASFNDSCNSSVGFLQVVKARPFIAARVLSMAVRAIVFK